MDRGNACEQKYWLEDVRTYFQSNPLYSLPFEEAFLDQSITKDVYDKKHQELRDEIQTLEIEMSEHNKADYDYQTTVATVLSVARRARIIFENSSEVAGKRAFLNYILQNPTVNGKKLCFTIASPFNLVLELPATNSLLRDQESLPRLNLCRHKDLSGHRLTISQACEI